MPTVVSVIRRSSAPCFWILAVVVLYLALTPQPERLLTGWDKSNHVLAFLVLASSGLVAWPRRIAFVCAGLLAYGGLIEVLQFFAPGRDPGWDDLLADAVGIAIGWAVLRMPVIRRALSLDA